MAQRAVDYCIWPDCHTALVFAGQEDILPLAIIVSKTLALTLGAQGHFDNDKSGDMNDPKLLPRLRPNHPIHVDGLGKRPLSMPTVHRPRPHTRSATNRIRPNHHAERGR